LSRPVRGGIIELTCVQCDAEISIDNAALMDKDILWFDIFMSNCLLVDKCKAAGKASEGVIKDSALFCRWGIS
jgi:hypothetical protein